MSTGKKETGKQNSDQQKKVNKILKQTDPIIGNVEKGLESEENSPMDPPAAYEGETVGGVEYDQLNVLLQNFMDEHVKGIEQISKFEENLVAFREKDYVLNDEINMAFSDFFQFFDDKIMDHNRREEKQLFPLLHKRLIESGESGEGDNPHTAVDMMEDDHVKFIQLASLSFNLFGLAPRLKDGSSQRFVYDTAFSSAQELVEMLRLHIFREDNILFPLAHQLIRQEEFDLMNED